MTALRKYRTASEIAQEFGFAVSTIYSLQRRGIIPGIKIGRSVRFDVDRLVEALGSSQKLTRKEALA